MKTSVWLSKATTVYVMTRTNARSQEDSSATRISVSVLNLMKSKKITDIFKQLENFFIIILILFSKLFLLGQMHK